MLFIVNSMAVSTVTSLQVCIVSLCVGPVCAGTSVEVLKFTQISDTALMP